jgi:3-oxoacyl-[acyl-carrier-protein] synthase I
MELGLAIAGVGARCSIGMRAPAVAAAAAAALNRFQFDERIRSGRTGAAITCAWLETLPEDCMGVDRMQALALAAAGETMDATDDIAGLTDAPMPVLLALPAPRPGFADRDAARLARAIIGALPIPIHSRSCAMVLEGHAGGLKLLLEAGRLLADGVARAVLVGGVESYRDLDALRYIERTGRLRTEDDAAGWIPGEGACFLLLTTSTQADRSGVSPLVTIEAAATSEEPAPWYSGRPTIGSGLTEALRAVLEVNGIRVEVYCDLNGEGWRADEWSYAYLRTAPHYVEPLVIHHPADCWGDVGAASGPMLIAFATEQMKSDRSASSRALVWTASDTLALRAACIVSENRTSS